MKKILAMTLMVLSATIALQGADNAKKREYEIGGPLAGVKLPLFKGDNGDIPGHPGSIPSLASKAAKQAAAEGKKNENLFTPQGQMPMVELYPGSVELFRTYYHKYLPIRSFYDIQSQIKIWTAPDLPIVSGKIRTEKYSAPLYWTARHAAGGIPTGKSWKPKTVVRAGVKDPIFKLDLGNLSKGLYCVRIVGAVETKNLRPFREPVFVSLIVNDRIDGGESTYRVRINYVDEFYSVVEIFFHASEKRNYKARLFVDEGSKVDLLIRNIVLDDSLAGCDFRAMKTKSANGTNKWARQKASSERLERDADIWNAYPRINIQGAGSLDRNIANMHVAFHNKNVLFGADGKDMKEIEDKWGKWESFRIQGRKGFTDNKDFGKVFMRNKKLNLVYTTADMQAGKPLPGKSPYKDDGSGSYWPNPNNKDTGYAYIPIGFAVDTYRFAWFNLLTKVVASKDENIARDAAVGFIRLAYQFPAMETANQLPCVISTPGFRNHDSRARKRMVESFWLPSYYSYRLLPSMYDKIFPYINGNEDLAHSIGRFVPWVKTSKDVIKLIDTYLMQTLMKRLMRYNSHTGYDTVEKIATVLGDKQITKDAIEWMYNRAFKYPLKPTGLQDLIVTNYDRSGVSYVGSSFYATQSEEGVIITNKFKATGLLPKRYDITNAKLFPKPETGKNWRKSMIVAGLDLPRIGDVRGPDKNPAYFYTDKEGKGKVPAWLNNPSRQVYNWITALASGVEHNDSRYRRSVYLRTGLGWGHHHNDTMDMQIVALCAPMTIDGGQRPGYSQPPDRMTRMHNLVGVDGREFRGQSWAGTIVDAPGARYMRVVAAPPQGMSLFERQVALIDVSDGKEDAGKFTLPQSYVFDAFRVRGGAVHTYNFHGPVNDQFETSVKLNSVPEVQDEKNMTPDQQFLTPYHISKESKKAGDAGKMLTATWRYTREGVGSEQKMAKLFSKDDPRRFLRLYLTSTENLHTLTAQAVCKRVGIPYRYSVIHARKKAEKNNSSLFGAIIEPYMGKSFIKSVERLAIHGKNESTGPLAMRVNLTNGKSDLCFADGILDKERSINKAVAAMDMKVKAMFAFVRADTTKNVTQTVVAGGTLLELPEIVVIPKTAEYDAVISDVNYLDKTIVINKVWPDSKTPQIAEIIASGSGKSRTTSYTVNSVRPDKNKSTLILKDGADYFRSSISSIDSDKKVIKTQLGASLGKIEGLTRNFTASNDKMTKFWRADYRGDGEWKVTNGNVSKNNFATPPSLRIWEYGKGDRIRLRTWISVRKTSDDVYLISGNVDAKIILKAASLSISKDGKTWKNVGENVEKGRKSLAVKTEELPLQLKWKK